MEILQNIPVSLGHWLDSCQHGLGWRKAPDGFNDDWMQFDKHDSQRVLWNYYANARNQLHVGVKPPHRMISPQTRPVTFGEYVEALASSQAWVKASGEWTKCRKDVTFDLVVADYAINNTNLHIGRSPPVEVPTNRRTEVMNE